MAEEERGGPPWKPFGREEGEPNLNLKVAGVMARTRVGVSDLPLGVGFDPAAE